MARANRVPAFPTMVLLLLLMLPGWISCVASELVLVENEVESPSCDAESRTQHSQCGLYLAESTIPNAGLGVFSGVNHTKGSVVAPPEIAHAILHRFEGYPGEEELDAPRILLQRSIVRSYTWSSDVGGVSFESPYVEALIPGLGMAANSFLSLVNARSITGPSNFDSAGLDRSSPGIGGFSAYHNVTYLAEHPIVAGEEIFVDYGDAYFRNREPVYGMLPLKQEFDWCDATLKRLWGAFPDVMKKPLESNDKEAINKMEPVWNVLVNDFVGDERFKNSLPKSISDIPRAVDIGCSNNWLQGKNPRPLDWLQTNGYCMDTLDVRTSDIPHAGRGAFAKRSFSNGERIIPMPLIQLQRDALNIISKGKVHSQQLLINYCLGHRDSPLVLLPYSSSASFINHGGSDANAKLVWASADTDTTNFHRDDWLQMSAQDVASQQVTGLLMHVVATRDISEGEEVTIDYGPEWAEAWGKHVSDWIDTDRENDHVSAADLNESENELRTVFEDAYPSNIGLACHYRFGNTPDNSGAQQSPALPLANDAKVIDGFDALYSGLDLEELSRTRTNMKTIERLASNWLEHGRHYSGAYLRPCKIITRESVTTSCHDDHPHCQYWSTKTPNECETNPDFMHKNCRKACDVCDEHEEHYLVRVYNRPDHPEWDKIPTDKIAQYVKNVPRRAITFVDRPFTSDQYTIGAFRHTIGFPVEEMWPSSWTDEEPRAQARAT